MYYLEIIKPGSFIKLDDHQLAWKIQSNIDCLISFFYRANAALNLFIENNNRVDWLQSPKNEVEFDAFAQASIKRSQDIEEIIRSSEPGISNDDLLLKKIIYERHESWRGGKIPTQISSNLSFICAEAFVFSLDIFAKYFLIFSNEEGAPDGRPDIYKKISQNFPDLLDIRNSAHHSEDRVRGLEGMGKNKKNIPLDILVDEKNPASGTHALTIGLLSGNIYKTTLKDGRIGEIEVSLKSMEILQSIMNETLNAFEWTGQRQHLPC